MVKVSLQSEQYHNSSFNNSKLSKLLTAKSNKLRHRYIEELAADGIIHILTSDHEDILNRILRNSKTDDKIKNACSVILDRHNSYQGNLQISNRSSSIADNVPVSSVVGSRVNYKLSTQDLQFQQVSETSTISNMDDIKTGLLSANSSIILNSKDINQEVSAHITKGDMSTNTTFSDSNNQLKYKTISNLGGGDCGVYAVRDMLRTIGHPKGNIPDNLILFLREEICYATKGFLKLIAEEIPNESNTLKWQIYLELYKEIFGENNFNIFKSVILRKIDSSLGACKISIEAKNSLEFLKSQIECCNCWESLDSIVITQIFVKYNSLDINCVSILEDHMLDQDTTPDIYYEKVSNPNRSDTDLIWLNMSEINAYLIKLGFVIEGREQSRNTYITFTDSNGQKIYLHNDGLDSGGNHSVGSHWQAALRLEQQKLSKLLTAKSDTLRHRYIEELAADGIIHILTSDHEDILNRILRNSKTDDKIKTACSVILDRHNSYQGNLQISNRSSSIADNIPVSSVVGSRVNYKLSTQDLQFQQVSETSTISNMDDIKTGLLTANSLIMLSRYIKELAKLVNDGHNVGTLTKDQVDVLKREINNRNQVVKENSEIVLKHYQQEQLAVLSKTGLQSILYTISNCKGIIDPFLIHRDLLIALNNSTQGRDIIEAYIMQATDLVIDLSKNQQKYLLSHVSYLARIGYNFNSRFVSEITAKFIDNNKDSIDFIISITIAEFLKAVTTSNNEQIVSETVINLLPKLELYNPEVQKNIIYALGNIAKNGYQFPDALNKQVLVKYQEKHQDAASYALQYINGDVKEPTEIKDIIEKYKDQTNIPEDKLSSIGKVLLNNSDPILRIIALEILNKNNLSQDLEKLVNIERDSSNLSLIKDHIKDHHLLTVSCLETLEQNLSNIEVLEILNSVLDNDQQQLPKSLTTNLFRNISRDNVEILIKIIKQGKSELPDNLCQLLLRQIEQNQPPALKVLNVLITKHKALIKDINDEDINKISLFINSKEQNIRDEARNLIISIAKTGKNLKQEVIDHLYDSGQEDALSLVTNIVKHYEQSIIKYQADQNQSHKVAVNISLSHIEDKYKLCEHLDIIYSSSNIAAKLSAMGKIKSILEKEKILPAVVINRLYQIIEPYSGQLKESCIALFADLLRYNPTTILELNSIIIGDIQLSEDFIYIITESALRGNVTTHSFNILLLGTVYGNESIKAKCKDTIDKLDPLKISSNIPLQKYLDLGTCRDLKTINSTIEYLNNNYFLLGDNGIKALELMCLGEENFENIKKIVLNNYGYSIPSLKIAKYLNKYSNADTSETSEDKLSGNSVVTHEEIINKFFAIDNKFNELFPRGEDEVSGRIVNAIAHAQRPNNVEILTGCPVLHLSHKILSTSLYMVVQENDSRITEFDLDEYLSNIGNLITLNIEPNYLDSFLVKLHEVNNIKEVNCSLKTFWIANKIKNTLRSLSNSVVVELSNYLLSWDIEFIEFFLQQYIDNTPQELLRIKSIATIDPQIIHNLLDSPKASNEVSDFIKLVNKELVEQNFDFLTDEIIIRLVDLDYSLDLLSIIYDKTGQEFRKIIDLVFDYGIGKNTPNYKGETIFDIINAGGDICFNISKLGLEVKFANVGEEKDLEILLNELAEKNRHSTNPINIDNLRREFEKINACFTSCSQICTSLNTKTIDSWTTDDIKTWSSSAKDLKEGLDNHLSEVIAVIKRANILDSGQDPRTIHILSLLLMSQGIDVKGTLAQIATGEGKTSIVSMLAIINALKGKKVDVITSSSILASEGAKKKGSFYKLFDFTVGDNGLEGQTGCYAKDIVYGSISNFQFDFLRDQYMLKGTRQNREFGVVIADEVDSMLIDEGSKIAMLSENIAGMEYLESLLAGVFATTTSFLQGFVHDDEGFLVRDADGNAMFIDPTIQDGNSGYIAVPDQKSFIMNQVKEVINKQFFSDQSTDNAFALPLNLKHFATNQVENWINMSLVASQMKQKVDYVIQDNQIKPVDYDNTGIIQTNTQWQNGLHQFLQIKHGLRVSPESFTTCFISNIGYFKQYGNKIYGVTGTLGSEESKKLLSTIYGVDCVIVPTYRQKQFVELTGVIKETHNEWINEVAYSTKQESDKGRGILVICKTIENVDEIEKKLVEFGINEEQIIRYANNESDKGVDGISIKSGQIIIATNLAGRGTDIDANGIEAFGGLHVCLTFLANNLRVEEQAFGRTSRQGKKGTGQLIICDDGDDIKTIKEERNNKERARLQLIETKEIKEIDIKDKLFLGHKDQNGNVVIEGFMSYIAGIRNSQNKNIVRSIEERWGLFFAALDLKEGFKEDNIIQQYNEFIAKIKEDLSNNRAIKGYSYRILIGNELCGAGKYNEAIREFDEAIELDPVFSYTAHYNKAYAIIKNKGNIQEAKRGLDRSKEIITETLIPQLQALMAVGSMYNQNADTECSEEKPLTEYQMQFNTKLGLLEQHRKYIEEAIKVINEKKTDNSIVIDQEIFLEEMYPSQAETPTREIEELRGEGFFRLFSVKEKPPTDWLGIIGVFILGALQTIAGAALTMCGFANLGNALIAEGISDFITGIKSAITGEFSLTDYLKEKAVSLAISVVTMGISAIKSAVKAAGSVGAGLKQIGSQVKNGAKTFFNKIASKGTKAVSTEGSKALTKEGMKVVMKNVGREFVEQGAKELMNLGVQTISKEILKQFETDIVRAIKRILALISIDELNKILADQNTANSLGKAANDFLSKQSSALQNIAEQFIGAAVSSVSRTAGAFLDAAKISVAIDEASSYTSIFVTEINSKIALLNSKTSGNTTSTNGEELIDSWSKQISDRIINIIHGKILNPLTNKTVSSAVGHCSKHVQKSLSTQGHTFDDKSNLWQNKKRLRENVEIIAQSHEHHLHLNNANNKAVPHNKTQLLHKDREGGMLDVAVLAAHLKQPIHIYKDGKLHRVIGKGDKPIAVDYTPPSNGKVGHWEPHEVFQRITPSGKNNCLFDAVGVQLAHKLNGQDLREIADNIRNQKFRHINEAQNAEKFLLQNSKPDKAKNATMMGGAVIDSHWKFDLNTDGVPPIRNENVPVRAYQVADAIRADHLRRPPVVGTIPNDRGHLPLTIPEYYPSGNPNHNHNALIHGGNLTNYGDRDGLGQLRRYQGLSVIPAGSLANPMALPDPNRFTEYDLHPRPFVGNRGSERLVSDNITGQFYYTGPHPWNLEQGGIGPQGPWQGHYRDFHPLNGTGSSTITNVNYISAYFSQYTLSKIRRILKLRLVKQNLTVITLEGCMYQENYTNSIYNMFLEINKMAGSIILVPVALYNKHAVGVMFIAQDDGSGYKAFYLDSENTPIPEGLATIFKDNGYEVEQLATEGQKYTNCGPEVIENFILYLTGERLSQEDAIVNNSRLIEQELLSNDALEIDTLVFSNHDTSAIVSNVSGNTQVSIEIDNPTRYDIVNTQSMIDGVTVREDLETDRTFTLLIDLFSDDRINQDYTGAILGEFSYSD